MAGYSFADIVKNMYSLMITKMVFPGARLVRRPIYISGKKGIKYGKGFTTGHGCRLDASKKEITLIVGENARIGDYVHINANKKVCIGNNVLMASKVFISDANHGSYSGENQSLPNTNPNCRDIITLPVYLGDNVWVGENVVILPGTKIGNGCIIGANAVVLGKTYPDNVMLAGIPAKIIKIFNSETCKWEKC